MTPQSFVIRHEFTDIDELGEAARAWDLVTARCEHERHRSVRHRWLVEHAVRLAREDARSIKSVAELSRQSGASLRTLCRGFRERFAVSGIVQSFVAHRESMVDRV